MEIDNLTVNFFCGRKQANYSIISAISAPVKILYIWVVAIVMVIAFGGAYRFPGFCGNQHIRDPTWSQNHPKSIPKQARKSIKELFCWFQMLRHDFMFLSFCIHLHASSFMFLSFACILHVPFILHSFPFMSFHIIILSFSFQCAFISFHIHFICMRVPFILH